MGHRAYRRCQVVPKGDILSGAGLAKIPWDRPTVLYCKTGIRSAEALAALKQAGFADAHAPAGRCDGVGSPRVEPSLPVY